MTATATATADQVTDQDAPTTRPQGVMHYTGDPGSEIRWRPDEPGEVDAAREAFDQHRAAGRLAYRPTGAGGGEQLQQFDPDAEMIIIAAPLQGG